MGIKATLTITFHAEDPPITHVETHTFSSDPSEKEMGEFLLAFAEKQEWSKGLGGEDNQETEDQVVEVLESLGYNIPDNDIEETLPWFYWDPIFKFSPKGSAWLDCSADPEHKSVVLEKIYP